jgi:histidinol-phosphate aminotransferase
MQGRQTLSRRGFVGGLAAAVGGLAVEPGGTLAAVSPATRRPLTQGDPYDALAKLGNNENPWGPSPAVLEAMTRAFKYANRYGYPDGDIAEAIAAHHGVSTSHILMGAGSGEILDVVGATFLRGEKKVVGVEPTYGSVYSHATSIRADAIRIPLLEDHRQDIPAMIAATRRHHRDVGFIFLCNPNNPTGRIVTKQEVEQLLDGIPEDVPVLVDEAYHGYVEDPEYATSVPYVLEGRPVIVARTFSKIYGMAGMRLGYAVATEELIRRMRPWSTGTINALVKWGGAAALKDTVTPARVKRMTVELRTGTVSRLEALGYDVIPSEANFFMVHIRRPVQPVIEEFRRQGVVVGRPFPPMLEHLRVSVGTAEEMGRFMAAFEKIVVRT